MLFIYGAESDWTEDERKERMIASMGISEEHNGYQPLCPRFQWGQER